MDALDPTTWSTPDGPYWRPGRHVLGAGTLFVDIDGLGERPICEASDLVLTVQVETLDRWGSVDGPVQMIDQKVTRVRRTLNTGTVDVRRENLQMWLGADLVTLAANSETVSTRDALSANCWWQLGDIPAATELDALEDGVGALTEGTDYIFDAARGRIMALVDLTDLTATWTRDAVEVLDTQPLRDVRGSVRLLSISSSSSAGHDHYWPLCVIRPDGPISLKSRRDWMRVGFEIQILDAAGRVAS